MEDQAADSAPRTAFSRFGKILKPSTRNFVMEARQLSGYSRFDFIHGYVYARWPYLYIGIGTGEHWVATLYRRIRGLLPSQEENGRQVEVDSKTWADGYHGKVMPTETVKQLVRVQEPIQVPDLEPVIPFDQARDLILKDPDHIVALDCPCRSARENPCMPLDVCLIVGEPFASFVLEHHPRRSRWISSEEAADILERERDLGHVHHAFFKDAMLGRFYAICNCCECCCGAMHAQRNGTPMLISSGFTAVMADAACIGCGDCVDICPFEALSLFDNQVQINGQLCMGCGICEWVCENNAIQLVLDPGKPAPLLLDELTELESGQ
jgi:ferredoxin